MGGFCIFGCHPDASLARAAVRLACAGVLLAQVWVFWSKHHGELNFIGDVSLAQAETDLYLQFANQTTAAET